MKSGVELTKEPGHLTEKSIAAAESGLSYGKWRAQFPPYNQPSAPAEPGEFKFIRKCVECNAVFGTDSPRKIYCSESCKHRKYIRERYGRKADDGTR